MRIGNIKVGEDQERLFWIIGPCVIESYDTTMRIAEKLDKFRKEHEIDLIFKASFDKANRTEATAFRGPGISEGLRTLLAVKQNLGLPITTDIHEEWQAQVVGDVIDLIQIPAMLSRQTDLITAAANTGLPLNIKKCQFMSPLSVKYAANKAYRAGNANVMVTERGSAFGYDDIVVDMRSIPTIKAHDIPVVFDASHSVKSDIFEKPQPTLGTTLAKAAVAAGCNGIFVETHEFIIDAKSDGVCAMSLNHLSDLVFACNRIWDALRI